MRLFRKNIFMYLAVLCALMFLSPTAFAGKASFEEGGDPIPPYGATGDPGGTKLTGVMYVRYENYRFDGLTFLADGATFALRLMREKSTIPTVFYGEYFGQLDFSDPAAILDELYYILEVQVEVRFFPGQDMVFKIKRMKNEGVIDIPISGVPPIDMIVLVDVEVSAKPAE
jgi:hypothetical protein